MIKRLILRRMLIKLAAEGKLSAKKLDAVNEVLRHPRRMAALQQAVSAKAESDLGVTKLGDGELMKWLWEHREDILAFILKIVELFKGI